MGTAVADSDVQ